MTRIPVAMAGLALVAVTTVSCGDDNGDDPTAADTPSATSSLSTADSPAGSSSTPAPGPTSDGGDPVPSPVINKAVKGAIKDDFPALVPSGVPAGWTVSSATYSSNGGGVWHIELIDPKGAPVTLMQSTDSVDQLVAQLLPDAKAAGKVDLSSYGTGKWQAYTGMSAAALAKALSGTSALVIGPDQDTVLVLAQELLTAENADSGDGG